MKSLLAELNMRYFNSANGFYKLKNEWTAKVVILFLANKPGRTKKYNPHKMRDRLNPCKY